MRIIRPGRSGQVAVYGAVVSGDAPATTNFLARTSGLSGTETTAYKAMINGLVTDGFNATTLAPLDCLYIFATNTTTTANLNLVSTSFGLTGAAQPTFAADAGYTSNGTSQFLNTGYTPSTAGLNMTQNSASIGLYSRGGRTTSNGSVGIGAHSVTGATYAYIGALTGASTGNVDLNGGTFPNVTLPSNTANGFVSVSRTASSALAIYKNGSSTAIGTPADTSTPLPTASFYICAQNTDGTSVSWTTDQISAAYIGGGITGAQHLALSNRINAYMTALGINVY